MIAEEVVSYPEEGAMWFLCMQADKEALRDVQSTSDALQERLAQLGRSDCLPCLIYHHAAVQHCMTGLITASDQTCRLYLTTGCCPAHVF